MILVGERINGLFRDVAKALQDNDPEPIQRLAIEQTKAGANFLDINTGPAVDNPEEVMPWLVKVVEEVVDTPICVDSPKIPVLQAGLRAVTKNRPMINSTTAQPEHLEAFLPMAKEHQAFLIALTMDRRGVPRDAEDRTALAMQIIVAADEIGYPIQDLFLDPLLLPVKGGQEYLPDSLETLRRVRELSDPAPKTIVGLSNVSQKSKHRSLIDRTFLAMAMSHGLDAAIANVFDKELVATAAAANVILNKVIYSDGFLEEAYPALAEAKA